MQYVIIPYIALGLILSLAIGIEYNCVGQEMFPTYYGSPFVFKQKSLGSSMEFYYSISGLVLNILVWSSLLFGIHRLIKYLLGKVKSSKWVLISNKILIGMLIAFTTLNIVIDNVMLGNGFNKTLNYWYWNMDKEATDWGMECSGDIVILKTFVRN